MSNIVNDLRAIVGRRHVLTSATAVRPYATGYRFGSGPVAAVVRPATLVEQWRVLQACVCADHIVIPQAANTGLTGGSTPNGIYDRPVVIVSTSRIADIHFLRGGEQVVCLAGATLHALERRLAPLGREPHSVIGSSCIGASIVGGVCNNSGGALVRRGPAYSEYALFARIGEDGEVRLHNHLGLALQGDPESILVAVQAGRFSDADIETDTRAASGADYATQVRDVSATSPARFNADPSRLYEASGSAGRVMVFAVRLDTFPADRNTATFYIGTNDPAEFGELRRRLLTDIKSLPVSGEYIHREAFDLAEEYGKDVFLAIRFLGTRRLPLLYALRNRVDALARRLPRAPQDAADRLMQAFSRLVPRHLPHRLRTWRDRFEHHLILKVADEGIAETRRLLGDRFPTATGDVFECTAAEAQAAFLHRFAVAGAAVRCRAMRRDDVAGIIALDVALRRDDPDWVERLPESINRDLVGSLYYGHFLCHVFHQDYLVRKGVDPIELEHRMWALLDERGAIYPAEHNVGHLYPAAPALIEHYRTLDPTNSMNPGIGHTSSCRSWR